MTKLILPDDNGAANFEIRRMQKVLEKERQHYRGVNPQTAAEISKSLDKLRELADQGELRALVAVALLRPSRELPKDSEKLTVAVAPMVKTLFSCPANDRPMALDLARMTDAFLQHVMSHHYPPDTSPPAA